MARVYVFTEEEKRKLIEDLELIKYRTDGSDWLPKELTSQQKELVYSKVHRTFHYHVVKFFDKK